MRDDPAAAIVTEALSWCCTPYRHQGRRKGVGCDCLGLVLGVWAAVHGQAPAVPFSYAPDWAKAGGSDLLLEAARIHLREKPVAEREAGDLVLFRWRPRLPAKHAGILVGRDRFVHAHSGIAVTVAALVPQWRSRIAGVFAFPDGQTITQEGTPWRP